MTASPSPLPSVAHTLLSPGRGGELPPELGEMLKAVRGRAQVAQEILGSAVPSIPLTHTITATGGAVGKGQGYGTGTIDWRTLRTVRESSCILVPIHEARQHALSRFSRRSFGLPGQIGCRIVHRDFANPRQEVPRRFRPLIKEAETVLFRTMPELQCHGVGSLLKALWDDYATLNRPVMELIQRDGELAALRPVDGSCVWETWAFLQLWARGYAAELEKLGSRQRLDYASNKLGVDLSRARYLWVEEGVSLKGLSADQVIVGTERTSTDIRYGPYPPGKTERALNLAVYGDQVLEYSASFFSQGMMSNWLIFLDPAARDEAQAQFAAHFAEKSRGMASAHQPVFVGADADKLKPFNLTPGMPRDFAFEGMLSVCAALMCAIYRIDPSTIGVKPWDGGSGPRLSEAGREEEIAASKEEGLSGDLEHLRAALLNPAIQRIHPELEVVIDTGDFDPKVALELISSRKKNIETTNEIRVGEGMKPLGFYVAPEDWDTASEEDQLKHQANAYNHVADPSLGSTSMLTMGYQQKLDAMQQAQQQPGQDPGQDPNGAPPQEGQDGAEPEQGAGQDDEGWPDVGQYDDEEPEGGA